MKHRNKLTRAAILLLAAALLLTGCGKKIQTQQAVEPKVVFEETDEEKSLLWFGTDGEGRGDDTSAPAREAVYWENDEMQMSIALYPDGTGVISNNEESMGLTYTKDGDVYTLVLEDNGEDTTVVDQGDGTVYFEESDTYFAVVDTLSYLPGEDLVFDGTKYQMSFVLYADGTGYVSDLEGTDELTHSREGDVITVTIPAAELTFTGVLQENGDLYIEAVDDTFVAVEEPGYLPQEQPEADWTVDGTRNYHLKGHYYHSSDTGYYLDFDGVGTVTLDTAMGEGTAEYHFDGEELQLFLNGSLLDGEMDFEEDLWLDDCSGWFVSDRDNFFKENNLDPGWKSDGVYTLENSARYFSEDGSAYMTGVAEWQIREDGERDNGDGSRTVDLIIGCGFPYDEAAVASGGDSVGCTYDIFDAYNGYELVSESFYNDRTGAYEYDFTQNGEQVSLRYTVESEWLSSDQYEEWGLMGGDYEYFLAIRISVTLPTDYDGLRIVAMRCDTTFEEYTERIPAATLVPCPSDMMYMVEEGLVYKLN